MRYRPATPSGPIRKRELCKTAPARSIAPTTAHTPAVRQAAATADTSGPSASTAHRSASSRSWNTYPVRAASGNTTSLDPSAAAAVTPAATLPAFASRSARRGAICTPQTATFTASGSRSRWRVRFREGRLRERVRDPPTAPLRPPVCGVPASTGARSRRVQPVSGPSPPTPPLEPGSPRPVRAIRLRASPYPGVGIEPTKSSPPSTRITLPVIQAVSGRQERRGSGRCPPAW